MQKISVRNILCCVALPLALSSVTTGCAQLPTESQTKQAAPDLRNQLSGAWVLAGKPGAEEEPQPGARMKFFGLHNWIITQADPLTGRVIYHHGGTYELVGDKLVTKVTFANENTAHLIGTENHFIVKVENDTYTQIGDGNQWSEIWKRADK